MSVLPSRPIRFLITDGTTTLSNFPTQRSVLLKTIELAVASGIEMIQIREKRLPGRLVYELAVEAVSLTLGSACKLLINERFDLAMAAGAHGVHLTSTSISVERVRDKVPSGFIVGVSTHSSDEVIAAKESGADYAMLGPIFATPDKGEPLGIEKLERVCQSVSSFPVIAVGSIDGSSFQQVLDAGAEGFAAIRYLDDFVRISQ